MAEQVRRAPDAPVAQFVAMAAGQAQAAPPAAQDNQPTPELEVI